jgi:N-acylglucosamine 2-epimerase
MYELNWPALADQYRRALLDDVMPFWLRHSLDAEYGGYLHYLDADGSVYCTDKMMWLQGREVWMFSRLYNTVEQRPEWLAAARLGAGFMRRHGRDENGAWFFLLDRAGNRTHNLKGGKWKGCFHVPRALLNCWQIAERMAAGGAG